MEQLVFKTKKGNAATDSLKIAKGFGKTHRNVLQAIDNLECGAEFNRLNFHPITYTDSRNRKKRAVLMTKSGFAFLVMGFTGKRAAEFKQGYIEQFNQMEQELRSIQADSPESNILHHTNREVQIANSKSINQYQYQHGGTYTVIEYNRQNCLLHTGKRPTEIRQEAKEAGMPSKVRNSAKEILRITDPAKACCMSLADHLVRTSKATLVEVSEVSKAAEAVFAGMMRLGVRPTQLNQ